MFAHIVRAPLPDRPRADSFIGMHCATCGKDSTNRRVCPFCFTPYPAEEPGTGASRRRTTGSTQTVGGSWPGTPNKSGQPAAPVGFSRVNEFVMRQTPTVRWAGLGIIVVLLLWVFTGGDAAPARSSGPGVQAPADTTPMTREEALAYIRATREGALVESQADEVFVNYSGATFPVLPEGQVALVRRFVRADEIVEGRRRRIFFYSPNGKMYAQSDAVTGITIKQ